MSYNTWILPPYSSSFILTPPYSFLLTPPFPPYSYLLTPTS